jgi:hypothetical protein
MLGVVAPATRRSVVSAAHEARADLAHDVPAKMAQRAEQ